jgi:thiamine pyrophosphate-dependent acetolactate synthase large subunit-like protein
MTRLGGKDLFTGADALKAILKDLGTTCVFGLPGSQNLGLFESLRDNSVRTVLATSEMAAGFMANGWFRASGQTGVYAAISGPGFAWCVVPLAEAALDSCATLLITGKQADRGFNYDLQVIKQREIAESLGCDVFDVDRVEDLLDTTIAAYTATTERGPRPVVLQISPEALNADWPSNLGSTDRESLDPKAPSGTEDLLRCLEAAEKPLLIAGGGALDSAEKFRQVVERSDACFLTTPTARGVVPEDHPMGLRADFVSDDVAPVNEMLKTADLIIALGARLSHNGTGGFGLTIDADKFAHIDLDKEVLGSYYSAKWALEMDVSRFLDLALDSLPAEPVANSQKWDESSISNCRQKLRSTRAAAHAESNWYEHGSCQSLFENIRAGLPNDGILVTDTGQHQIMTRTYFDVMSPRGLIFPSDFQSMGFGLPAAIGAALAAPDRSVMALIGDGSFLMTGSELLTAKSQGLSLPVIVFTDGYLGQIRMQQLKNFGVDAATKLDSVNLSEYAKSLGISYLLADGSLPEQISTALGTEGPTIIEVKLADGDALKSVGKNARRKRAVRSVLGPKTTRLLKRLRRP